MRGPIIIILVLLAMLFCLDYLRPIDGTDESRFNRSGMTVYTDNATGIQYLSVGMFGSLTARLGADGKPLLKLGGK